ncbi:hypothetical protein DTO280E4_2420 [Paecilomyces variotii]|nr:hypothetical protein DTO280E4_2420 [Paecilomyces variotii]
MSHTTEDMALNQLQQEQSKLLDKIDELRTIGVGGLVELPQLIVGGNQSSGKSSVLEAISRVRFPAKSNVCTRFATEVILRRSPSSKIKISIEPGPSRNDAQERSKLRSFTHEEFSNGNDLPALIEKAREHMGITESVNSGFSDDVLKVEISGPDKPELTLVDLPGLYYSTSQDQGSQGIKIVRTLTEKYMQNSRSIILAVISAKTDYHLQEVLNIAERFDPDRERTLGIITQPDILEANSEEEDTYLHFIKNQKVHLQLGWHALRNRSFETRDISDDARDEREKAFFNQGRWNSLPRECVGIDSLRRRLSSILLKHIRHNLPGLITDIQEKIADREQKLSKLGPPRSTLQQQRGFLLNISSNFERITAQALNGMYADEFFGGLDDTTDVEDFRRIRAVIRQLNEYFADAMSTRGSRRQILDLPAPFGHLASHFPRNPYMHDWKPDLVRRAILELEVSNQARKNRGIELPGSANQLLVGSLFRDQSKPWEALAREHLMKAWESARYFVSLVLQHLTDDHTYSLLVGSVLEPEFEKLKQALFHKLDELTAYTKRGHPLPVGNTFLTRVQKARDNRELDLLRAQLKSTKPEKDDFDSVFSISDIRIATQKLESTRDEFAAADIIDQMQAYYDTAIVTFVDNVATLGIENCLVDPLQRIFTSQVINDMEDNKIQELATELSYISEERDRLDAELKKLQAGLRALSLFNIQKPLLGNPPVFVKEREATPSNDPSQLKKQSSPQPATSTSLLGSGKKVMVRLPERSTPQSRSGFDSVRTTSPAPSAVSGGLFGLSSHDQQSSGFGGTASVSGVKPSFSFGQQSSSLFGPKPSGSGENTPSFGGSFSASSLFKMSDRSSAQVGDSHSSTNGLFARVSIPGESDANDITPRFGTDQAKSPSTKGQNRNPIFVKLSETESSTYSDHLSFIPPFDKYSPEELRLGDYARGDKVAPNPLVAFGKR